MQEKFTEKELLSIGTDFLKETFDMELLIPMKISRRMKSTFGAFRFNKNTGEPVDIRISGELLKHHEERDIISTVKHECVHYALYMLGKPFKDGEKFFEDTLEMYGIDSTMSKPYKGMSHLYTCTDCDNEFYRVRRIAHNGKHHRCPCGGKLDYAGQFMVGND